MRRRAERLARAVEVAAKMWRLEQARLAQLEQALTEVREAEAIALQAFGALDPKFVLDRVSASARRRLELEAALSEARARARDCGRRMKLTEKLHADAVEAWRSAESAEERRQRQRPVSSPF
jgi:hypothetical protein